MQIIKAQDHHFDEIWGIFHEIVQKGETYVYDPKTTKDQAYDIWMKQPNVYVGMINDEVTGTYIMRPNFPGLGSHIANCSYMINHKFRGQGIGKALGEHSLKQAKELGFLAMQFNIVISTNQAAVKLWQSLGFQIIGTVPQGFNHQKLGYVDTYIMHRML